MAIFGRRLSLLRQRVAAAGTTPVEVQRAAATAAVLPIASRLRALTQAVKGEEITQPIISPRQAVQLVRQRAPSLVTSGVPPGAEVRTPYTEYPGPGVCPPGSRPGMMGFKGPQRCTYVQGQLPYYVNRAAQRAAYEQKSVAAGITAAEARPSIPGIGPLQPQADGDPSFWKQMMSQGLQRVLGPATTTGRPPPQPGVEPKGEDRLIAGMPTDAAGWLLPAALVAGLFLLRR